MKKHIRTDPVVGINKDFVNIDDCRENIAQDARDRIDNELWDIVHISVLTNVYLLTDALRQYYEKTYQYQ